MYRWLLGIVILFSCLLHAEPTLLNTEPVSNSPSTGTPATSTDALVQVPVLEIKGPIGPAVSNYLIKEIGRANFSQQTPLIIITMDTPGGLASSLRDINQSILNSQIPIACLVYPQGARAASAGTYILYACHIAAMASATTLGAATPVMIQGPMPGSPDDPASPGKPEDPEGENAKPATTEPTAMEKKVLNDSIAYIRSLAQLRGRDEEWAEQAVREAATLTASEALSKNVIDLLAQSPEELIIALDGREVKIQKRTQQLDLSRAQPNPIPPDWRSNFIATITNPNIAYILMLIGVYGLLLEFYSPGVGVAGITGAISLFIALYAFQLLPLNYVGFTLLLLGIALLIAESMVPSFGIFGMGGLVAFVMGSIFLIDTEQQQYQISLQLIAAVAFTSALFFIFILGYLWDIRKNKVVSGKEAIIGEEVIVANNFTGQGTGFVEFRGERWAAYCDRPLKRGQIAVVNDVDGLTLILHPDNIQEQADGSIH